MAPDRQARRVRRGHAPRRGRLPAARHQRQPRRFHGRGRAAVRYALGALKGVGEKAMEALVAERERGRAVRAASRISPARIDPRLLNRRQLESLAGAGAFDGIKPDRAGGVRGGRDDPRPCRQRARPADQRAGGLFGGGSAEARADPPAARRRHGRWPSAWRPSATRSASISRPTRSMRSATCSPRTMSGRFAELAEIRHRRRRARRRDHGGAGRGSVAGAPRREGRRYMMATPVRPLGPVRWRPCSTTSRARRSKPRPRRAAAGCSRSSSTGAPGDDAPRVTIKRFQPLDALAKKTRLQMIVRVPDAALAERVARELPGASAATASVRFIVPIADGGEAVIVVGRDYRARRRARRAHRAHHRRGQRRAQRPGAAEAGAGRLNPPGCSRRMSRQAIQKPSRLTRLVICAFCSSSSRP